MELKFKRLKSHYPEVFPMDYSKEKVLEILDKINTTDKVVIRSTADDLRPVLLALLIKNNKFENLLSMNAYRIIDIYLGQDEFYESISSVNPAISFIYYGYSEMSNQRQVELFSHYIEQQLRRGKKVWVFLKGDSGPAQAMFNYCEAKKFETIELGKVINSIEEF